MTRILASATVNKVQDIPKPAWSVHVHGGRSSGGKCEERVYRIDASSDNLAAQEGIRRFVEELQADE